MPSVSLPLGWDEVEAAVAAGDAGGLFGTPADALARVERLGDPFAPVLGPGAPLPET